MPDLDREGIFRVRPDEWTLRENKNTGSVNLSIRFIVIEEYAGDGQWSSWADYEPHEVYGNYNLIKKNGKLNDTTVQQLIAGLGWSSDLLQLSGEKPFEPWPCQVQVKFETYDNVTRLKAGWMSHYDSSPGPQGIDDDRAAALQSQYGGQLRALVGNMRRETAKADNVPQPSAPPTPPALPPGPEPSKPPPSPEPSEDIFRMGGTPF